MDSEKPSLPSYVPRHPPAWLRAPSDSAGVLSQLTPARVIAALLALFLVLERLGGPTSIERQLRRHSPPLPLPRDLATNHFLTESQCNLAFPGMEKAALAETAEYWRKRGGLQESWVVEHGNREQGRGLVYNNRVYVKRFRKFLGSRDMAMMHAVRDAVITSLEPLPNVDFAFRTFDLQENYAPQWQMMRKEGEVGSESVWLMPDFGFYAWPEPAVNGFDEFLDETDRVERETPWADKTPQIFWRGAMLSEGRKQLVEIANGSAWADIDAINWKDPDKAAPRVDIWDSCKYRFLAHTKGVEECGRLKYLMACESVVIQRSVDWRQHWDAAIDSVDGSPTQNTVVLQGNGWDELPRVMEELLRDEKKARRIARNARNTFRHRYLTPAATTCYWRSLIRAYGKAQAFEPTIYGATDFESWVLMDGAVEWDPS